MSYSKNSLKQMAKSAAQKYVSAEKPMNATISKIAKERDLNKHQVKRVSEFANHMVNAKLAKKTSYTDFELADPDEILGEKTASFAGAYLGVSSDDEITKEASSTPDITGDEIVQKIAESYGVDYNFHKIAHSSQPVYRLLKFAHEVIDRTAGEMYDAKMAMEENEESLFEDVKEALLSGISIEQIAKDLDGIDQMSSLKKIWPRLEAGGLVQESHYEQGGPYSDIRRLKKASRIKKEAEYMSMAYDFSIDDDAPMLKKASRFSELDERFEKAVRATDYIHKYACSFSDVSRSESEQRRVEKVAARIDEKMASAFSKLKAIGRLGKKKGKKAIKPFKDVAKATGDVAKGVGNVGKKVTKKTWDGSKRVGKAFKREGGPINSKNIQRAGVAAGLTGAGYAATKDKFKEKRKKPGA